MLHLKPLPYPTNALEPYISGRTIAAHYGKHHAGYVKRANELLAGAPEALSTQEILLIASRREEWELYNNVAQAWNHEMFWHSMHPAGGGVPPGEIGLAIERSFGAGWDPEKDITECTPKAYATFCQAWQEAANLFGSGWVFLLNRGDGAVAIEATNNAHIPQDFDDNPRLQDVLLVQDVWEHAYYLDHLNDRASFTKAWLAHLTNWTWAEQRLLAVWRQRRPDEVQQGMSPR